MTYLDPQQALKKNSTFRIRIYLVILAVFLVFSGLVYTLIYSPVFKIDNFVVEGKHRFSDTAILNIIRPLALQGRLAVFFGNNNLWAWPSGEINVAGTPLAQASIEKDWLTRSLIVAVQERERFGIWCVSEEVCYWMDANGIVFEEAPFTEGSLILKIYDLQNTGIALGVGVVEERFRNNLMAILKGVRDLKISSKKIVLDRGLQELKIYAYQGPDVFFSIRFDPKVNLDAFQKLSGTLDLNKISYFDLRVENRIFYKN